LSFSALRRPGSEAEKVVARRWEVYNFMLKHLLVVLVGICVLCGQALASEEISANVTPRTPRCWQTITPQNVPGFDFEITSVVRGPDKSGLYTYTYTIYRIDQIIDDGIVRYRELSHISFWFPCGPAAERAVVNGIHGITVTCTDAGSCPKIEMGETNGMAEPVMDKDCKFFWGFKLDECVDTGERMFLLPNHDGVSFPMDPYDPSCTITFTSRSAPEWGKWLVKGGDGKSGLFDSGDIKVPTCIPAVDIGNMTWGQIKIMYH
jgi:hypothetical protein